MGQLSAHGTKFLTINWKREERFSPIVTSGIVRPLWCKVHRSRKQKAEREDGGRCYEFFNSFKPTRCWSKTFHVLQSGHQYLSHEYLCNLYLVEGWSRVLLNVLYCSPLNELVVPVSFSVFHTDQLDLNHMFISKIIVMYWCGIGRSFLMAILLILMVFAEVRPCWQF